RGAAPLALGPPAARHRARTGKRPPGGAAGHRSHPQPRLRQSRVGRLLTGAPPTAGLTMPPGTIERRPPMEPLPRGSQFIRAKTLWEVALDVAGDFSIPYTGNRDICISIGSGSGETFRPALRMSVGSPILAHAVVRGELELAF